MAWSSIQDLGRPPHLYDFGYGVNDASSLCHKHTKNFVRIMSACSSCSCRKWRETHHPESSRYHRTTPPPHTLPNCSNCHHMTSQLTTPLHGFPSTLNPLIQLLTNTTPTLSCDVLCTSWCLRTKRIDERFRAQH